MQNSTNITKDINWPSIVKLIVTLHLGVQSKSRKRKTLPDSPIADGQ
jgi:hypothetical protein